MSTSHVSQKGQVTIPVEIRRALGLKTGSKVRFRRRGQKVTLEAVDEPGVDSIFGLYKARKGRGIADIDGAIEGLRRTRGGAGRSRP